MKIARKLCALALGAAMSAGLLSGCGGGAATTPVPTQSAGASEPSAAPAGLKTVEEGKLHMSTNAAFPPYEMVSDDGGFEGIDVEVAEAIAAKLGLELVVDDMDFDAALMAAQNGQSDIVMAGVTVTEERQQVMDFSDSYATGVQMVIVKEGSPVTMDNLGEHMIGCQRGTTGYIYASDTPENGGYGEDHVIAFDNGATAVQALVNDQVDCVIIDAAPAQEYVKANPGLTLLEGDWVTEDYAIGMQKGNTALLEAVNSALGELIAGGQVQDIVDKYIAPDSFETVEEGKLHMSTDAAFPPYEMLADDGSYEGIDIEIAQAIADKLGLELVVEAMDFDAALLAAQSGQCDMVMAGVTVTKERQQVMEFSESYTTAVQVVIVKEGSPITAAADLANADQIGAQRGTTGYSYCVDDYGEDHVTAYDNGATAVQALTNGQIDAVVIDVEPAKAFVAANPGLKILDSEYVTENYAIGFQKGNTALCGAVNDVLRGLIEDGSVQAVIDRYITAE